jgi:hypothetical protein
MRDWSRQDIFGIAALVLAVIGCLTSVMLPETREFLGLSSGNNQTTPLPVQQASTPAPIDQPASIQSAAVPSASSLPQLQKSGTDAVAEDARETQPSTEAASTPAQENNPTSEESITEMEARLRHERSGRDRRTQDPVQDEEELRREAEARSRREQPARDQTTREELRREADARSLGDQTRVPVDQPAPSRKLVLPEGINENDIAGIKVLIRYRGAREQDALAIEERLSSYGIQVTIEQDNFQGEAERWNRIYYPACHKEAAQAIKSLVSDLLRLTLISSKADCDSMLDIAVAS